MPVALQVNNDFSRQSFEIRITPQQPLAASSSWTVQLTSAVADQRGGSLLVPFSSGLHHGQRRCTAACPGVVVSLVSASRRRLARHLRPRARSSVARQAGWCRHHPIVAVRHVTHRCHWPARLRFFDVVVEDPSGLSAVLPVAVQLVEPIAGCSTATPDHGPVEGGTRVTVELDGRKALVAGSQVLVGGQAAAQVDVRSPSSVSFTIPEPTTRASSRLRWRGRASLR